jgi:hypothetical protein
MLHKNNWFKRTKLGCQMVYFQNKIPISYIFECLRMENVVIFYDNW